MLGLKLLELRARRDIHVTVFLVTSVVLTQFLYEPVAGTRGLPVRRHAGADRGSGGPEPGPRATAAGAEATRWNCSSPRYPLALVVFMLFPRLHSPLWGIKTQRAFTGISGEMTLR